MNNWIIENDEIEELKTNLRNSQKNLDEILYNNFEIVIAFYY